MKGKIICLIFVILFAINFVVADFTLGGGGESNASYEVQKIYGPGKPLQGWINISFEDEPADSQLSAFSSNKSLLSFLQANGVTYSCFPADCQERYSTTGSDDTSHTFAIGERESIILGLKIEESEKEITDVIDLSFDISTNAGKSCSYPIEVDVLNDGIVEWQADELSNEASCFIENPYGCFNPADSVGVSPLPITTEALCEKITLFPLQRGFKIGANIIKANENHTDKEHFVMTIDIGGETCTFSTNKSGEIGCLIELEEALSSFTEAEVCIKAEEGSENTFKVRYEEEEPCGYGGEYNGSYSYDFEIFAKPLRYMNVSEVTFEQDLFGEGETMANDIMSYIEFRYEGKCDPECIIPIRIKSGIPQEMTLSNFNLEYKVGLPSRYQTEAYIVEEEPALIDSDFLKLDLEKANLIVPNTTGDHAFILKLGSSRLIEDTIGVKRLPIVLSVGPRTVPALVPVNFGASLQEPNVSATYVWNFGDGSSNVTTSTGIAKHTYNNVGTYTLTVSVSNEFGSSSKQFSVSVIAPDAAINTTINDYRTDLEAVKVKVNALPEWIQKALSKQHDVDLLTTEIDRLADKYSMLLSGETEEFVKLMQELLALRVPYDMVKSQIIPPRAFIQSKDQIDYALLENPSIDAGTIDEDPELYSNAINNWMVENLETNIEYETYEFHFRTGPPQTLFSRIKLTLTPKTDISELYFLINRNPADITFAEDYGSKDIEEKAAGIIFWDIPSGETKTIEFLLPEKISLQNYPFFLTPNIGELNVGLEPGVCNFNKICEDHLGEDSKNCRSDCKPVWWTVFWIVLLLFVALVLYVALQEWYKRHYEKSLFKNKNELFNLITFMNNAETQGLSKAEIFTKLKKLGWNTEQLHYAWNKLHGYRTGMWEIPIFKWIENKKVKKELDKRKTGIKMPPRPGQKPPLGAKKMPSKGLPKRPVPGKPMPNRNIPSKGPNKNINK
jgi:PKD repeat protein